MTHTDYLMEVSILSTILFAHHQKEDEAYFNNIELYEEWFSTPFHRIVVKAINHNKQLGMPIYEEFIAESLAQRGQLDFQLWTVIISANPFSKFLFEGYLEKLKGTKKALIGGI